MQKFSIILPVHNGGEMIKACVNSILSQTYKGFNLLVLDNKSCDGTTDWIHSLDDKRISVHTSEVKLSIEENWARIKSVLKNEFITLIGYDDILMPNYLEEMDKLINKYPDASLYQTHFHYIDAKGELLRPCKPMDEIEYAHDFLAKQFKQAIDSTGTGYMFRSKDYDQLGGIPTDYPNLIFADYKLWCKLTLKSYKATSEKNCFKYRVHNSVSKLTNGEEYSAAFEKYMYFIAAITEQNAQVKEIVEKYGKEMLLYNCESLSHRILKTPVEMRSIKVKDFIATCKKLASILIPGQEFEPEKKIRINIAARLDNPFGRFIFQFYRMFSKK